MIQTLGRLQTGARNLKAMSVTHIEEVFGKWISLPQDFGQAVRKRLFFPLTHLLAVPLSSALEGAIVQRDPANISRMARLRARRNRLAQHRRLLQSARPAFDKRHTENAQEGGKENRETKRRRRAMVWEESQGRRRLLSLDA